MKKWLVIASVLLAGTAQAGWNINNGQTSVIRNAVLYQSADPDAVITTVTSEDSGLTVLFCDNAAATCTTYDAAAEFEPITTFGTYAAPTASNLRIEHIGGGMYQLQFADAVFATGSQMVMLISGAGVYPMSIEIFMDGMDSAAITTAARSAIDTEGVAREATLNATDAVVDNLQLDTDDIQSTLAAGVTLETNAINDTAIDDTQTELAPGPTLNCTVNTANFAGDVDQFACVLTDRAGTAVTQASGDLEGLQIVVTSGAQIREARYINDTTWDATNSELQLQLSRALPAALADAVTVVIR